MGISRDHLEKIELKLKTERGWREGLTVNSACGPSGDSNFTPPYSPVCCLPAACRSSFRSSWMPSTTSFLKKKKKQRGIFSRPKGGHGACLCRDESAGVCTVVPSLELWVVPSCGFQGRLQLSLCEQHHLIIQCREQPPPNPSPEVCFRHPSPIYLTREIKLEGIWPSGYRAGKCFERPSGWITPKPPMTDENLSYF